MQISITTRIILLSRRSVLIEFFENRHSQSQLHPCGCILILKGFSTAPKRTAGLFYTFALLRRAFESHFRTKNSGPPVNGNRNFRASVLIGLFKKRCHTDAFLNFRASNFLVFTSYYNEMLKPYNQKYLRFLCKCHYCYSQSSAHFQTVLLSVHLQ